MRVAAAAAAAVVAAAIASPWAPAARKAAAAPQVVVPTFVDSGLVFPVASAVAAATDNFGSPRADVPYHHGDDIFAPLGTPIVAVADGRLLLVGENPLGGLRLWLADGRGDEFYYAHLEHFAAGVVSGERVSAGQLLGWVGQTGDAESTPPHLHFEVHPAALVALGYDGAVDPWAHLARWRRLDAPLRLPAPPRGSPRPVALGVHDISSVSGLVPGALVHAVPR